MLYEIERKEKDGILLINLGDSWYSEAYEEFDSKSLRVALFQVGRERFALVTESLFNNLIIETIQVIKDVFKCWGYNFDPQEDIEKLHQIMDICDLGGSSQIFHMLEQPILATFDGNKEIFAEVRNFLINFEEK